MSNHGKTEEYVPKRRAHAYFIKPAAQAEINTNKLVGSRNSRKDEASHSVQGLYTRIQQLDTKANIKNSYIHTHTTSWHWHCPVEVSYWVNMASQTTSINRHEGKQCKKLMMDWDAAPRGRGAGQIVIILITAMCSTTHTGKFNQTGRWRQPRSHSHTGWKAKHVLSIGEVKG